MVEKEKSKWKLVWQEEFSGNGIDASKWSHELGHVRNHELQNYTDRTANGEVSGSCLTIRARKEALEGFSYTSASIHTCGKMEFLYGRLEMRAKLPFGKGIWPAFWLLGADYERIGWPKCGEIDICELVGSKEDAPVYGTLHYPGSSKTEISHSVSLKKGSFAEDFHIFGVDWTEEEIAWYVDDVVFARRNIREIPEMHKPYYLIVNLAVGGEGDWPGPPDETTSFPKEYVIDWIRYYH